jgi:hypothetical protein
VRVEVSRHLALALGSTADVPTTRDHYDAYDSTGTLAEVLVPFQFRPGLSLGADLRP